MVQRHSKQTMMRPMTFWSLCCSQGTRILPSLLISNCPLLLLILSTLGLQQKSFLLSLTILNLTWHLLCLLSLSLSLPCQCSTTSPSSGWILISGSISVSPCRICSLYGSESMVESSWTVLLNVHISSTWWNASNISTIISSDDKSIWICNVWWNDGWTFKDSRPTIPS